METFTLSWSNGLCRLSYERTLEGAKSDLINSCNNAMLCDGKVLDNMYRTLAVTEYRDGAFKIKGE